MSGGTTNIHTTTGAVEINGLAKSTNSTKVTTTSGIITVNGGLQTTTADGDTGVVDLQVSSESGAITLNQNADINDGKVINSAGDATVEVTGDNTSAISIQGDASAVGALK